MSLVYPQISQQVYQDIVASVVKEAAKPVAAHALAGRLYVSQSGWGLLAVPNAIVRGCFDALDEPGVELPVDDNGKLTAHISVFSKADIEKIGGPDKLTERGGSFRYTLGRVKTVVPHGWSGVSRVWFIEVKSPELQQLRRSYGLSSKPHDGEFEFHCTIGIRKANVLNENEVSKAAAEKPILRIAGASGAGKTTTLNRIADEHQGVVAKDLDDFSGEVMRDMGIPAGANLTDYNWAPGQEEEFEKSVASKYQQWLAQQTQPVVVSGFSNSGLHDVPADNSMLLNTWPSLSALRAVRRNIAMGLRAPLPELLSLPKLWQINRRALASYKNRGYTLADQEQVLQMARHLLGKQAADECCPNCDAFLERGDDDCCNRCGEPWPDSKEAEDVISANYIFESDDSEFSAKIGCELYGVTLYGDEIGLDEKAASWLKTAAPGMGIPDRANFGDLSKLTPGELFDFVVQEHAAQRAGLHSDIRIGGPSLGLYSWAARKGLPAPGAKHLAVQQPLHAHGYKDFQGTLKGYGAGTVKTQRKGQILLTGVQPGRLDFSTADERYPERFTMIRTGRGREKDWLLLNTTPKQPLPYEKVHYKRIPAEQMNDVLDKLQPGSSVQPKLDGASSLIRLVRDGVEVLSYRTSKTTGRPIVHTERMFGKKHQGLNIPKELVGSILKGELYGLRKLQERAVSSNAEAEGTGGDSLAQRIGASPAGDGAADQAAVHSGDGVERDSVIPPQELGGILNATLANSLKAQKERNIKLRSMLYDVQQLGSRPIHPDDVPYSERMQMLRDVAKHLPEQFHVADEATDAESAKALWETIRAGKHPLTSEGVVIHPPTGKPMKSKFTEDHDVYVKRIFPGKGKYTNVGAGGFGYSLTPDGPEVGEVGTGISDDLRKDLFNASDLYLGRVAKVRAQQQLPSGALRAPALIAFHEG